MPNSPFYIPCGKTYHQYHSNEKQLQDRPFIQSSFRHHCRNMDMSCSFSDGVIYIQTKYGSWKINHKGCFVLSIFHRPYCGLPSKKQGRSDLKGDSGYHIQKTQIDDVFAAAKYIWRHDIQKKEV